MAAPDAVSARSDLPARVTSALVLAIVVLAATWVGGWPFRLVWAIVGGLVAFEWLTITGAPRPHALAFGGLVALLGAFAPFLLPAVTLALVLLATMACWGLLRDRPMTAFGIGYAAVIALAPAALRDVPGLGLWLIVWSFAVVWLSDIAAYFTGRTLGGPKLMPSVSPKKTWSGALGGLAAGVLGALAVWKAAMAAGVTPPLGFGATALVSAVATVLGQAGDLAESALKRAYGVKDSSQIIPGHGGFMDRLDAYWAVVGLAGLGLVLAG